MVKNSSIQPNASRGFTLIELLVSATLGLIVSLFAIQSLYDFMRNESTLSTTHAHVGERKIAVRNMSRMIEMAGIPSQNAYTFLPRWNYTAALGFDAGVFLELRDGDNFLSLRVQGDPKAPLRDCHGSPFEQGTQVVMHYRLVENTVWCESTHFGPFSPTTQDLVIARNIVDVAVTAVMNTNEGWLWRSTTEDVVEPGTVAAVLIETVTRSEKPIYPEPEVQIMPFNNGPRQYESHYQYMYYSQFIPLANQELQRDSE